MKLLMKILLRAQKSSDVVLAVAMACVLGAMIVPLPEWLLDLGLALNLMASISLLVAALYARDALKVTSFPTLLLFTTLFRLALNVSSTRLALAHGRAGDIIQAFGEFVVGGEYVVGLVVFAILTLVQFLVVAKGAERVAEVSARFTLDAMPGKQMSIDADLRAGAINQGQARLRRRELERESQMFGAMDGAMKFVKGDVIAGLVIVLVNLLGGTAIGALQHGMPLAEAAATYALIAIGDGLVSQIPSLCIAVAAGLVVTRVASETENSSLGAEIGAQFFGEPKALYVVSGMCVALGLIPGMPHLTFLVLAVLTGGGGYALQRLADKQPTVNASEAKTMGGGDASSAPPIAGGAGAAPGKQQMAAPVGVAPLTLDLAPNLTVLTEEEGGRFGKKDLGELRDAVFADIGIRVPGVRVRVQASYLPEGTYQLLLDEVPCGRGEVTPGQLYVFSPPKELAFLNINAEAIADPITGKTISKVSPDAAPTLVAAGVLVRNARNMILEHVRVLLRKKAALLLGVQEVQGLLDAFEPNNPTLVKEALNKVPLPLLTEVLRKLVQEEVSIRNLRAILEALVAPTTEGDANALAERCRQALHRYLSHKYAPSGPLYAYLVDPGIEVSLREAMSKGNGLDPNRVAEILEGVKKVAAAGKGVLLVAPDVRRSLRRLCEGAYPDLPILTYAELDTELQIRPIGRLNAIPLAA